MDKATARKTLDAIASGELKVTFTDVHWIAQLRQEAGLGPEPVTKAQVDAAMARLADASTASPPPSYVPADPPGPPRHTGSPSLIGADGVIYDDVPGAGYQPRTRFGREVTDTSPGGQARTDTSPGLLPSRLLGGPLVTGPGGELLYPRPPMTITGP